MDLEVTSVLAVAKKLRKVNLPLSQEVDESFMQVFAMQLSKAGGIETIQKMRLFRATKDLRSNFRGSPN